MAYGAQFSFGVFFAAMLEEFGWSRAALSGAFALYAFGYSAFSAVAGNITDRHERHERAVAPVRLLRGRGRARHVDGQRPLRRDGRALVRQAARSRHWAGHSGGQLRRLR